MDDTTIQLPAPNAGDATEDSGAGNDPEKPESAITGKEIGQAVLDRWQQEAEFFEHHITIDELDGRPMMKVASPVKRGYHGYFWIPTALTAPQLNAYFERAQSYEDAGNALDNAWIRRKPLVTSWNISGLDLDAPPEDVPVIIKRLFTYATNEPLEQAILPGK